MKKLFLSSSFIDVALHFEKFANEDIKGKTVTFIPTASIPEEIKFYVANDKSAFERLGIIVDELNVSEKTASEIEDTLNKNDYIYVSGGNTFYLLQELKNSGADKLIINHINKGKIYIGASAGSVILSPNIDFITQMDDKSKAPELNNYNGLAMVDFYTLPHHTNPPFKEMAENIITDYHHKINLVPISNSQVIEVNDGSHKVIG